MGWRNGDDHWGRGPRLLHWLTALLVAGLWVVGSLMVDITDLGQKFQLYQLHKSFGVLVFALVVIRLIWRASDRAPDRPAGMARWEIGAAHAGHALLYILLVAMPLSGYLMTAAAPLALPTVLFGVIPLPHIISPDPAVFETMRSIHGSLAWLLLAIVAVHVLAALKHHFVNRDAVLTRMVRAPR